MLRVTPSLEIPESELHESFVRAPGPGGQNVNKVATAVMLRFDAARSTALTEAMRTRLATLAGRRMTDEGVIVIIANRHRTQPRNREDARQRLAELLARAAEAPPPPRRATRPTKGSVARRLDGKARDAKRKAMRRAPAPD
jgi:ribosome-associated protein